MPQSLPPCEADHSQQQILAMTKLGRVRYGRDFTVSIVTREGFRRPPDSYLGSNLFHFRSDALRSVQNFIIRLTKEMPKDTNNREKEKTNLCFMDFANKVRAINGITFLNFEADNDSRVRGSDAHFLDPRLVYHNFCR